MALLAYKLDSNRYLTAIKSGFFAAMSILIIGSIFLLLANLPINGYADFMAGIFGANWSEFFMVPYNMTMNIMTPFVIIGISKSLSSHYKVDDVAAIVLSIVSFLILTPSLITAILATEIMRAVVQRGWVIKMPESVPSNVARSFSSLIPGLFVILSFNVIRMLFAMTSFETAHNFIFEVLQTPLLALGGSLPAMIIVLLFEAILWSFGIHGSQIVSGVMSPIWLSLTAGNAEAFAAGQALPNIINSQFHDNFIKLGGAGSTLGLALCALFFAKSKQFKTLGKLAIGPGMFNINEPLIFGIPIVLNPIMLIPFIINPIIMAIVAYAAMSTGLVNVANGVNIPWTTPPIFSGFLVSGWTGALLQVFQIFLGGLVYYPFFKLVDQKAYMLEQGKTEEEILEAQTTDTDAPTGTPSV
ncbi:PTS sugar transporter subunit IIC [Desemzia sp. FAM 24101]|uniref:PTS sugar transporter subunit IIC n=1 Tax=unclassified Desemzia TaxID=2685243 RepID=UPI0038867297